VKGENLILVLLAFCLFKTTGHWGHLPGPNLPKEKEPPHRGDIGWDRFLLRQFGLQSYSFFPSYKLCDNILAPLPRNTESNLPQTTLFR
jgi:hypothetical protein